MTNLVIGSGYLGGRVARRWRETGRPVLATTRYESRSDELAKAGFEPIIWDVTDSADPPLPSRIDTVLWSVGFDRLTGKQIDEVYVQGLRKALNATVDRCRRFIYISSTGVYGQAGGEWVDEQSECVPLRDGGRACLAAECLLQEHELGGKSIILRLAGIYGLGRIPRSADVRAGIPITANSEGFLNLIHVDDAVGAVCSAESSALVPELYVVSDGNPVPRREYYGYLADLLHAPAPRFQQPTKGSAKAQRGLTDKRVCNHKMLRQLGIELRYPTYRDGLADALGSEANAS